MSPILVASFLVVFFVIAFFMQLDRITKSKKKAQQSLDEMTSKYAELQEKFEKQQKEKIGETAEKKEMNEEFQKLKKKYASLKQDGSETEQKIKNLENTFQSIREEENEKQQKLVDEIQFLQTSNKTLREENEKLSKEKKYVSKPVAVETKKAEPAAQADAIEKIVSEKLYLDLKADHSVLISKYKDLLSESDKIQKKAQNNHTLYMVTKGQLEIVQDRLAQALYGKGASSPLDDNNLNDNGEDDDDNELTELLKEETSSDNTTSSEPVNSGENLVH